MNRVLYYAFGGGLGHVVRTVALARQLARLTPSGGKHLIVCNTPFDGMLPQIQSAEPAVRFEHVPATASPASAACAVAEIYHRFQPDVLVVDTFPRGLGGDLVDLLEHSRDEFRVLVSRGLPPNYITHMQLLPFVEAQFDFVIVPGEQPGLLGTESELVEIGAGPRFRKSCRTDPFLVRDFDELPHRKIAAAYLDVDAICPVVLVVASGNHAECKEAYQWYQMLSSHFAGTNTQFRLAFPESINRREFNPTAANPTLTASESNGFFRVDHWPLIECLPAVDLVIGNAGYNLFWETRQLQIPAYLMARQRLYDNQTLRSPNQHSFLLDEAIHRINLLHLRNPSIGYVNGAKTAAVEIWRRFVNA